ncbi:MAG: hypothetical protein KDC38_00810 [Planctomycetes bacterium]|nr:hypothetical protein [Planctomycetota bacterium]
MAMVPLGWVDDLFFDELIGRPARSQTGDLGDQGLACRIDDVRALRRVFG